MPRTSRRRDEDFGEDDPDAPLNVDVGDEDDELDTRSCPHCRSAIYEDAEQCPHCKEWIVVNAAPATTRPVWLVVTAIVAIVICLWWALR